MEVKVEACKRNAMSQRVTDKFYSFISDPTTPID